jgi:UDP-N-acetylmuramoyl-L-alanyl-D-glutamate--2,6-diaminopimelate ligase
LAHSLAGDPSRDLKVIGVTGTNGKSSTVFLIQQLLESCGHPTANFGTLGYFVGETTRPAAHTTPFGEDLASLFREAREVGLTHAAMEASSHAIEQERIAGIDFDAAVFTNLTQDHLDYHGDMGAYLESKLGLIRRIEGPDRFTVVNIEDPSAQRVIDASAVPCHSFGAGGDCRATKMRLERAQTFFHLDTPWGSADVELALLGRHNVLNALGAITACGALGVPFERIVRSLSSLRKVPGRFEHVDAGQPFQVIVDYAHTEDGLRNVLTAARKICDGRIIVVFGCGGDRDVTKRPKMAAAAAELSDFSIITSDNPRTEDPDRILLDIEVGIQRAGKKKSADYWMLPDRREAIERAIGMADADDLVMLAGKGHEDYQILGTERIHFDDREVAFEVLYGGMGS